jgi:hypothetical protein
MLVGMEDKNQPGPKSRFAEVIRKGREKRDQMERLSKDRREEEKGRGCADSARSYPQRLNGRDVLHPTFRSLQNDLSAGPCKRDRHLHRRAIYARISWACAASDQRLLDRASVSGECMLTPSSRRRLLRYHLNYAHTPVIGVSVVDFWPLSFY